MFLTEYIFDTYNKLIKEASSEEVMKLDKEMASLKMWADRHSDEIKIPKVEKQNVLRLVEHDKKIYEFFVLETVWPLEDNNGHMLSHLDDRIVDLFKKVRKIGFKRPSIMAYGRFFYFLHSKKMSDTYTRKLDKWASACLLLKRIEGTTKIALRFDNVDKYGPRQIHHKDGDVSFLYGKAPWKQELINRGILSR